ncbi:transcription factor [Coprinopsis marcescibilis]|uniref:Transcription factor n=1 Tax=Coprinopsis marcescibilis TaxID=230819 RepID=A0A5C3LCG0_COPMA|nr:transcription factor [Coprinopsis marcescibilis]
MPPDAQGSLDDDAHSRSATPNVSIQPVPNKRSLQADLNSNRSSTPSNGQAPSPVVAQDPNVSIQSILTASKKDVPQNGSVQPPWNTPQTQVVQSSTGKRKLDETESEDTHSKIRRIVRDHVSQDPSRVMPMTTVICLHAAVAQKSYGSEKRFLCPPPIVHIEGPVWHLRSQQLSMAVVSETGERSFEQKATLDNNMVSSFKFLHVTGTAKAKSFQLSLDISEPPISPEGSDPSATGRVWATFDSAPVTIISKPSKKTAKTRNISSCILAGGPVSLFNRINSQTVRTKYMTIDQGQLCASNIGWSAFNVNVVRRPDGSPTALDGPAPVTYGCEIVLSDTQSGISTSPMVIRKVDKGRVSPDDGGPVSQMQKIALQRVNPDGSRHYLSAAGPLPGTGVVAPPAPGMSTQVGTHPLLFQNPRIRDEVRDGIRVISDEVDDYLCWTIVGISKFQYTFFDAFGQNNKIPEQPVTPFPTLFTAPVYRGTNNTIELTVSNFFCLHPKTRIQTPLDVYLGNLGPLPTRVYQTTQPGPLTSVATFMPSSSVEVVPGDPNNRYMPSGPLHTIVIVEMPPIADVIKALEDDALPSANDVSGSKPQGEEGQDPAAPQPPPLPPSIAGRSLPLLFIRSHDGVGYHSGRTIACDPIYHSLDLATMPNGPNGVDPNWLAAAQAAAEGNIPGWTLRVM